MRKWAISLSGVCLLVALGFQVGLHIMVVATISLYLATVFSGWDIVRRAVFAIRNRIFGIELIVTLAVVGALWIGEAWEAAIVTCLFTFGAFLEERALQKTRLTIRSLFDFYPDKATLMRNGKEQLIQVAEVTSGDKLIVRSGEKVPADGFILSGSALVNQAAITGESRPVHKSDQDRLYCGSILESGYLILVADKVGEQTTLSGILRMVETAEETKAPVQKFLETFAKYYTPLIVLLAISVYLVTHNLNMALTLLVISCPGALVIAAPVSIVTAVGAGARMGVLFKGGESLEGFAKVDAIAFDKTGTLTMGRPAVTHFTLNAALPSDFWYLVACAELPSEHYLARAVVQAAKTHFDLSTSPIRMPDSFREIPGMGVEASIDGQRIWVGNAELLKHQGIEMQMATDTVESVVYVAGEHGLLGTIYVADEIREDAKEAVLRLRQLGIQKIIMLTGDHSHVARHIALRVGIDEVYANLLPGQKMEIIHRLQGSGYSVGMVGDGINDGPALAAANQGISLYGGTDLALEHANVILMRPSLLTLPNSLALSRRASRNLKENIYAAVAVVGFLILGVLLGRIFLASGMLIHEMSILAVVLNALRLRSIEPKRFFKRQVPADVSVALDAVGVAMVSPMDTNYN